MHLLTAYLTHELEQELLENTQPLFALFSLTKTVLNWCLDVAGHVCLFCAQSADSDNSQKAKLMVRRNSKETLGYTLD